MCATIALKLCTWLYIYIYDLQIKFEDGPYRPIFWGVIPLNAAILKDFTVFLDFSGMCAAIALKICTWLYIYDLQIKFEDGSYRPIFGRVMSLELSHFKGFYSFPDFFPVCVKLLNWNFVHGFMPITYKSSSKMVAIDQFLEELCPLNLAMKWQK
jgi:hypothetical protein